jgi:uncharacterized Ntn-hydrolase superfamily protein
MSFSIVASGDTHGLAVASKSIAVASVVPAPQLSIDSRVLQSLRKADA